MNIKNVNKKKIEAFFDWIRRQPCCVCSSGTWNEQIGEWNNTISHVQKRGSTRRNEHFNNVVPMCLNNFCHQRFELESKNERNRFYPLAEALTREYLELQKSKEMWQLINSLQKRKPKVTKTPS